MPGRYGVAGEKRRRLHPRPGGRRRSRTRRNRAFTARLEGDRALRRRPLDAQAADPRAGRARRAAAAAAVTQFSNGAPARARLAADGRGDRALRAGVAQRAHPRAGVDLGGPGRRRRRPARPRPVAPPRPGPRPAPGRSRGAGRSGPAERQARRAGLGAGRARRRVRQGRLERPDAQAGRRRGGGAPRPGRDAAGGVHHARGAACRRLGRDVHHGGRPRHGRPPSTSRRSLLRRPRASWRSGRRSSAARSPSPPGGRRCSAGSTPPAARSSAPPRAGSRRAFGDRELAFGRSHGDWTPWNMAEVGGPARGVGLGAGGERQPRRHGRRPLLPARGPERARARARQGRRRHASSGRRASSSSSRSRRLTPGWSSPWSCSRCRCGSPRRAPPESTGLRDRFGVPLAALLEGRYDGEAA